MKDDFGPVLLMAMGAMLLISLLVFEVVSTGYRNAAIEKGVARYNSETGKFEYVECKK